MPNSSRTKRRLEPRHRQSGASLLAFLGYLFSLIWVGGSAFMVSLFFVGGTETTPDFLLSGLVFLLIIGGWTWFYFRLVRRRRQRVEKDIASGSLADTRLKERRRDTSKTIVMGLVWVLFAGVALTFVGGFVFALVTMIPGVSESVGYAAVLVVVVLGVALYNQLMMYRLMYKPTGRMVLWLRRFHEDGAFPFDLLLEDMVRSIALPVTVQDTTVTGSSIAARTNPRGILVQTIAGSIGMGMFIALVMVKMDPWIILPIGLPLFIITQIWALREIRRDRTNDLRTGAGQKRLAQLMSLLDGKKKIPNALTTFRMSDDNWKEHVETFIKRSDAIIIDITHLTESLGWELNTCKKLLRPEQMILACGHVEDSEEDPWPPLLAKLEQMLGAEFVSGCQRFTYTRPRSKSKLDKIMAGWEERKAIKLRRLHEVEFLGMLEKAFGG